MNGPVVNVHVGVVAHARRITQKDALRDVHLVRAEDGAVEEIERVPFAELGDPCKESARFRKALMRQTYVWLRRYQTDLQPQRVAQRAVGIGKPGEQARVPERRALDDAALAGEDLHFLHRLVHQPVTERRRFDPQAAHRAADRDGLELRHHRRQQAVAQRFLDERGVRRHPLDIGDPALGIDAQHMVERAGVQPVPGSSLAAAEQIGGRLPQPDRDAPRRRRAQVLRHPVTPRAVFRDCVHAARPYLTG